METEQERRTQVVDELRGLADDLEANPDAPLPYPLSDETSMLVFAYTPEEFRAAVKLAGSGEKRVQDDGRMIFEGRRGPLRFKVVLMSRVCERVQVGTKTETRQVPVGEPEYDEVVEEVPVYEWRCPESILRPDESEAVPA